VLAALAPILLDSGLPAAGLWTNTPASRFASGALFGVMISLLLLSGIPEFIHLLFITQPQNRSAESSGGSL
jgi:hypothetical protein